jgi:hypothetical protein
MEPTRYTKYYEDVYTQSKHDDYASDVCENSSDDERNEEEAKQQKNNFGHMSSYGSIKRPTCDALPIVRSQYIYARELTTHRQTQNRSQQRTRLQDLPKQQRQTLNQPFTCG